MDLSNFDFPFFETKNVFVGSREYENPGVTMPRDGKYFRGIWNLYSINTIVVMAKRTVRFE